MGYDEGERNFGVEVPMEQQAQVWHNRCGGGGAPGVGYTRGGGGLEHFPAVLAVLVGLLCVISVEVEL